MRTLWIAAALAAAAALVSCSDIPEPETVPGRESLQLITLTGGLEGDGEGTRTIAQSNGSVVWNYNQETISVFTSPGAQSVFTKKPGSGRSAEFSGYVSSTPSEYVAIYPYSEDNDMQFGGSVPGYGSYDYCIRSFINEIQEPYPNDSFSMGTYPMATASSSSDFTMYGLAGGLRFRFNDDDVWCVIVRSNAGEPLSGPLTAGLSLSNPVPGSIIVDSHAGQDKIAICDIWRGSPITVRSSYLFAVLPPVTLSKGFTIFLLKKDGTISRAYTDKQVEIKRATFSRITNLAEKLEAPASAEPVDLGLSVNWSSCNVGTLDPWDTGLSFAWGMTLPGLFTESDYTGPGTDELFLSDDAAHAALGGDWRMPTKEEFQELISKCTWTRTENGWKVTSKVNGASIILPDASYWTSTRGYEFRDGSLSAWDAPFNKHFIRPVSAPSETISFVDKNLEAVLVAGLDTDSDGKLSKNEVASVDASTLYNLSWGDVTRFTSFDEFKYFTGVTTLEHISLFYGWSGLESISIPPSVSALGSSLFYNCTSLKSVNIPSSVKKLGGFEGCTSFTAFDVPEGVEELSSYAFQNCSALTSITLPRSLKKIGSSAFWGCTSLRSAYIPGVDDWVNVDIGREGGPFSYSYSGRLYAGGVEITSVSIPSGCTRISDCAFDGCIGLRSVTFSGNLTEIGKRAFRNCSSLVGISIPGSVREIGYFAFSNCRGITSLVIPEGVEIIGMFAFECPNLKSVSLPSSLKEIGASAFSKCSVLSDISIADLGSYLAADISTNGAPWSDLGSDTPLNLYIGGEKISDLVIPAGTPEIKQNAFYNCKCLTSLTVPSSVKTIGHYSFYNCSALEKVNISEGLETIASLAFDRCSSLSEINLPESLLVIEGMAFRSTTSLTSIVIPKRVTSLGLGAFQESGLKTVDVRPVTPPEAQSDLFKDVSSFTIYVPSESVSAYKEASGWSEYASRIQAKP